MPSDSDPLLPGERRHVSPDGRTVLRLITDYDPRDIHESGGWDLPQVFDAESGACVLSLYNATQGCTWEWEGEGGLRIGIKNFDIRISVPDDSCSWNLDGWQIRSLKDTGALLRELVTPPPTSAQLAAWKLEDWISRVQNGLGLVIFGLMVAVLIAALTWLGYLGWQIFSH